jgi:hypothetical protein
MAPAIFRTDELVTEGKAVAVAGQSVRNKTETTTIMALSMATIPIPDFMRY